MALCASVLDGAQILGGRFAAGEVRRYVVGNLMWLIEGANSGAFDRADVHEDILVAILRLNETEALLAVEPLHRSLGHGTFPSVCDPRVGLRTRLSRRGPRFRFLDKCLKRARLVRRRSGPVNRPRIDRLICARTGEKSRKV